MNLRFIETFVLLARLGSFRAVAQRLNTTQPAVSARIGALERELGVSLFVRSGRGASLTPEGQEALRHAEAVMAGWTALRQAAAGPEAYAGPVRVGAIDAVVRTWLPGLIERIGTALPRATVEITADTSINLTRGVASGDIHLALSIDPPGGATADGAGNGAVGAPATGDGAAARWIARPVCTFAMAWVASPDLVPAKRPLTLGDLAGLPIITYPVDTPPYRLIADYLGEGALPRRPASSSNSLSTMIRLAADGLGLAAIPPACIARPLADGELRVVPVEKPFPPLTLHALARGPAPAPLVRRLLAEADAAAEAFCAASDPGIAWR
jgi:DNA-binding transcriptional LysR family regulator